jgi:hypothetical protein
MISLTRAAMVVFSLLWRRDQFDQPNALRCFPVRAVDGALRRPDMPPMFGNGTVRKHALFLSFSRNIL